MSLTKSKLVLALAATLSIGAVVAAEPEKPKVPSMQEILDAAPKSDWRTLDPANTLYLELPAGRVVIELAPDFAPEHVANIRTLAKEGYWDGLFVIRSQDNYVAQWGDPEEDESKKKKIGTAKPHLPAEFERAAPAVARVNRSAGNRETSRSCCSPRRCLRPSCRTGRARTT